MRARPGEKFQAIRCDAELHESGSRTGRLCVEGGASQLDRQAGERLGRGRVASGGIRCQGEHPRLDELEIGHGLVRQPGDHRLAINGDVHCGTRQVQMGPPDRGNLRHVLDGERDGVHPWIGRIVLDYEQRGDRSARRPMPFCSIMTLPLAGLVKRRL